MEDGRAEQRLGEAGNTAGARSPRRQSLAKAARGLDCPCDHGVAPLRGAPARGSPTPAWSTGHARSPLRGARAHRHAAPPRRSRSDCPRRPPARRTRRDARRRGRERSRSCRAASAHVQRSRARRARRARPARAAACEAPSQTIALPRSSSQWYEAAMSGPHVAAPAFSTSPVRSRQRAGAGLVERPRAPACDEWPGHGASLFRPCQGDSPRDSHCDCPSRPRLGLLRGSAAARPRLPPRAGRAHAGVVHAPGGAFAPRVPGAARASWLLRAGRDAGALRGGDAPAGAAARRRCSGALRGHHDARARNGHRRPARGRRRPDGRQSHPQRRRREAPAARHPAGGDAGGDPPRPRGAVLREGARGLLRRAVHGRLLPRRGPWQPRLPGCQGADVPRARGLARAARAARRRASPPTSRRRSTPAPT